MAGVEKMTMAAQYLEAQIATLDSFGFPETESLRLLGISKDKLSDKYARFDVSKLIPLYETAAETLNDPDISLRTGFKFRVTTFQKTGNIYTVCDNIRQVVDMNARYQRLAIYAGEVSLVCEKNEERCFLDFATFYTDTQKGRPILNLIFGAYGTAFRWLNWGSGKGLKAVFLKQSAPTNVDVFTEVFDCPVFFEAPFNRLEFFPEHLDLLFATRDPIKRAQFESRLDHVLKNDRSRESLISAVNLTIMTLMNNGMVSFPRLAETMDIPERRLREALNKAGTNFRKQVDEMRMKRFMELIDQNESFVSIAQKLCYNDQAAFSRAFKRWYGVAPGEWTKETPLRNEVS